MTKPQRGAQTRMAMGLRKSLSNLIPIRGMEMATKTVNLTFLMLYPAQQLWKRRFPSRSMRRSEKRSASRRSSITQKRFNTATRSLSLDLFQAKNHLWSAITSFTRKEICLKTREALAQTFLSLRIRKRKLSRSPWHTWREWWLNFNKVPKPEGEGRVVR